MACIVAGSKQIPGVHATGVIVNGRWHNDDSLQILLRTAASNEDAALRLRVVFRDQIVKTAKLLDEYATSRIRSPLLAVSGVAAPMQRRRFQSTLAGFLGAVLLAISTAAAQSPRHDAGLSPKAKAQIDSVRRAVARFDDPQAAEDAGYQPVFGLIPLQGVHYVRPDLVEGGKFDLAQPPVLMYAPVKGAPALVGVAYAYQHPRSEPVPQGFDGTNDDWHAHDELSREEGKHIVMVHLWLTDAPGGPFARYNPWLPYMAASLKRPSASELVATNARGDRARRFAFALAIATHPPQLFDMLETRGGPELTRVAYPHRRALMAAVDSLEAAERSGDRATYERLETQTLAHSDSLIDAYRGIVISPRARELINKALDELMGLGHEGHEMMPGTQRDTKGHAHP